MGALNERMEAAGLLRITTPELRVTRGYDATRPLYACNPEVLDLSLETGAAAHLVVLHDAPGEVTLRIALGEGARLELTEIFLAEAFVNICIDQQAASSFRGVVGQFTSARWGCTANLAGAHAEQELDALFLASGNNHCAMDLRVNHNVADCTSRSLVKGIAGGSATGEFRGLVYVATDAQRTDAQQQSRNILLSRTSHIDAKPQLEIYADDVRCSHGATVGQMNEEAIFYMRQRGLTEAHARRLQVEGFAADVVNRCPIESLREAMQEVLTEVLDKME